MQSRWYHTARLHLVKPGHERKVGWLELFYDLVYVAAIIQLGDALSHHVSLPGFLAFAAIFAPLWFTWTGFMFFTNRFAVDDAVHRGLVFLQMFAVGALALTVPDVLDGRFVPFAVAYSVTRLSLAALYLRTWRQTEEGRPLSQHYATRIALGAPLWLVAMLIPQPWTILAYLVCMGVDMSVSLGAKGRELASRYAPDVGHMAERYGILTIIVLGESFVKLVSGLAEAGLTPERALLAGVALIVTISLWWIYFDDIAGSRIRSMRLGAFVWIYSHLPLAVAITAIGVAVKKATLFDPSAVADPKYRWLMAGSLSLALLFVGVIASVSERRQSELPDRSRVQARLVAAGLVLLLAPAGATMSALAFMLLVALACVGQVIFDLSMAPLSADPELHADHAPAPQASAAPAPIPQTRERRRLLTQDAVRIGTPDDLKRDLYFHLMSGSWSRVLLTLIAVFLLINVVFASLFLLQPDSVSNLEGAGFLDALSFSVQTITTIGYGGMMPVTSYGHVLVIIEAFIGVFGAALATGILFARASRPSASVLFSDVAVVTQYNGRTTLELRAGNARGNEIIEATMRVVLLRDDVSAEGHRMRRIVDLPLVRDNNPMFTLSWTVMHIIDERSPLYGVNAENVGERMVGVLALLTGHDSTYAQTVHARSFYFATDLRFGHRFADVTSSLPDGRLVVDYRKFHDTIPEAQPLA